MWTKVDKTQEAPVRKKAVVQAYCSSDDEGPDCFPAPACFGGGDARCFKPSEPVRDDSMCTACAAPFKWYRRKRACFECTFYFCSSCASDQVQSKGPSQYICDPCVMRASCQRGAEPKPSPAKALAALGLGNAAMLDVDALRSMLEEQGCTKEAWCREFMERLDQSSVVDYPSLLAAVSQLAQEAEPSDEDEDEESEEEAEESTQLSDGDPRRSSQRHSTRRQRVYDRDEPLAGVRIDL